jgi:hypothetical protein
VSVKVLKPLESNFVSYPAIVTNSDSPISWDISFLVLGREVVLSSKDKKGWDRPASSVDCLDHRHLLPITWLDSLRSASPLCSCHDELSRDLAYHKASFVEVVYIIIIDAVRSLCLLYKLKPATDQHWILI